MDISKSELNFSRSAIKRKNRYLLLSIIDVTVGLGLTAFYTWQFIYKPDFAVGIHVVLVILILVIARLNLRQHYFAKILEKTIPEK